MSSEESSSPIRRTTYFSGRVQGVGFRFTTESVAERFNVCGFVRNLPDGRVELVAEGARNEVERFEAAVEDAMRGNIRDMNSSDQPSTGEFEGFGVRT